MLKSLVSFFVVVLVGCDAQRATTHSVEESADTQTSASKTANPSPGETKPIPVGAVGPNTPSESAPSEPGPGTPARYTKLANPHDRHADLRSVWTIGKQTLELRLVCSHNCERERQTFCEALRADPDALELTSFPLPNYERTAAPITGLEESLLAAHPPLANPAIAYVWHAPLAPEQDPVDPISAGRILEVAATSTSGDPALALLTPFEKRWVPMVSVSGTSRVHFVGAELVIMQTSTPRHGVRVWRRGAKGLRQLESIECVDGEPAGR